MMIELHLIGIGTGNPDHLTAQACVMASCQSWTPPI